MEKKIKYGKGGIIFEREIICPCIVSHRLLNQLRHNYYAIDIVYYNRSKGEHKGGGGGLKHFSALREILAHLAGFLYFNGFY